MGTSSFKNVPGFTLLHLFFPGGSSPPSLVANGQCCWQPPAAVPIPRACPCTFRWVVRYPVLSWVRLPHSWQLLLAMLQEMLLHLIWYPSGHLHCGWSCCTWLWASPSKQGGSGQCPLGITARATCIVAEGEDLRPTSSWAAAQGPQAFKWPDHPRSFLGWPDHLNPSQVCWGARQEAGPDNH